MRKMDKLSNEMISKHDVPSYKRKEIKRSTRRVVAKPEFFKWGDKLLTNTILYRHVIEINSKQIY